MQKGLLCIRLPHRAQPQFFQLFDTPYRTTGQISVAPSAGLPTSYFATEVSHPEVSPLGGIPENLTNGPSQQQHIHRVKLAIKSIDNGEADKLVISRFSFSPARVRPVQLFDQLCAAYPAAYVYLLQTQEYGTWMGASPETLFSLSGDVAAAMSLAGTRPVGSSGPWGKKEQDEQNWVTRYLQETFLSNGFTDISIEPVSTLQAGPVEHLLTQVSAKNGRGLLPLQIAQMLHPTPAVAGYPLKSALPIIQKIENYNRSLYTGYILLGNGADHRAFVNLRCMQIFEQGCVFYVGGGITAQSVPEEEWIETENKLQTLRRFI